ncbi:hypothetical protein D3C85_1474690 [compost metagenome]
MPLRADPDAVQRKAQPVFQQDQPQHVRLQQGLIDVALGIGGKIDVGLGQGEHDLPRLRHPLLPGPVRTGQCPGDGRFVVSGEQGFVQMPGQVDPAPAVHAGHRRP